MSTDLNHPGSREPATEPSEALSPIWAEALLEAVVGKEGVRALKALAESVVHVEPHGEPHPGRLPAVNLFRREGEYWTLIFQGTVARLKDSKGLHDIAYLLSHPGRETHVADLMAAKTSGRPARGGSSGGRVALEGLTEVGLSLADGRGDTLIDSRARQQYHSRLADLQEELEEAEAANDPERAAHARDEFDFITAELAAAHGLGGRARRTADTNERARRAVTQRIRRDLARIEQASPVLGEHLLRSIKTGVYCSYCPSQNVAWQF